MIDVYNVELFEGLYVKFLDKSELVRNFEEDTEKERIDEFRSYYFYPSNRMDSYPVLSKTYKLIKVVKQTGTLVELETIETDVPINKFITSIQFLDLSLYNKYEELYNEIYNNNINRINSSKSLEGFAKLSKLRNDFYSYIEIRAMLQEYKEITKKLIQKMNQLIVEDCQK